MMGHLVLGRKDAGSVQASPGKGWIWRMWRSLLARTAAHGR